MRPTPFQRPAGAPNFRDLGGLRTSDGRMVRRGLVFRSEALLNLSDEDTELLAAQKFALVCDLRSASERIHAPNKWCSEKRVKQLSLDILTGVEKVDSPWLRLKADPTNAGAFAAMKSTYAAMPDAALPHVIAIVERIISGDTPMLIHCTAGKDRTGFISAVLLAALEVSDEAIIADYLASEGQATEQVRAGTRQMVFDRAGVHVPPDAIDVMIGVDRRYIDTSLQVINTQYGGAEAYLSAGGVGRARLDLLRGLLIG